MRIPVRLGDYYLYHLLEGTIQYNDEPEMPCYEQQTVYHTHDVFNNKHEWFEEGMHTCGFPGSVELLLPN